jgi:hypothetical protein
LPASIKSQQFRFDWAVRSGIRVRGAGVHQEVRMQTGLHAVGWSLQRLSIVLALGAIAAILAYSTLIFVIVAVQAVAAFGQ